MESISLIIVGTFTLMGVFFGFLLTFLREKFEERKKLKIKNQKDGPFCVDCKSRKESKFCVNCQKETSDLYKIQITEIAKARESIGIKQKRQGFKGFIRKIFQGYKPSGDIRLPEGVDVQMIVDREKNEYHQIVKNNLTGKIIHEEHEPLDQHKSKNEKTIKK